MEWKNIEGYDGLYQVSDTGEIRSVDAVIQVHNSRTKPYSYVRKGCVLKQRKQNCGYNIVKLSKNGKMSAYTVHRIVAETFIPNPKGYSEVNHKNGIKTDNNKSNLEWCSRNDNIRHSYQEKIRKHWNRRKVMCVETKEIFESIKDAGVAKGVNPKCICHVLAGRNKIAGGYKWQRI